MIFDIDDALNRVGGDEEFLKELIDDFIKNFSNVVEVLYEYLNKGDIETENELNIGDEFKAVKEVMINKAERQDCLPVDFHLIL